MFSRMNYSREPAAITANVAAINKLLGSMPGDWRSQIESNRDKMKSAGAPSSLIIPSRPVAYTALKALNLNNQGDISSEASTGQLPRDGIPVPDDVRAAAMEGLRLSHANNYGGYDFIGIARAIQLAISPSISSAALNRMRMYFDRKTKQDRLSEQYDLKDGRRYWSWMNWGGDPGAIWSESSRYAELVGRPGQKNPVTVAHYFSPRTHRAHAIPFHSIDQFCRDLANCMRSA